MPSCERLLSSMPRRVEYQRAERAMSLTGMNTCPIRLSIGLFMVGRSSNCCTSVNPLQSFPTAKRGEVRFVHEFGDCAGIGLRVFAEGPADRLLDEELFRFGVFYDQREEERDVRFSSI